MKSTNHNFKNFTEFEKSRESHTPSQPQNNSTLRSSRRQSSKAVNLQDYSQFRHAEDTFRKRESEEATIHEMESDLFLDFTKKKKLRNKEDEILEDFRREAQTYREHNFKNTDRSSRNTKNLNIQDYSNLDTPDMGNKSGRNVFFSPKDKNSTGRYY